MKKIKWVCKLLISISIISSCVTSFIFLNNSNIIKNHNEINSHNESSRINNINQGYSIYFKVPGSTSAIIQNFNLTSLGFNTPLFSKDYANELFLRTFISENWSIFFGFGYGEENIINKQEFFFNNVVITGCSAGSNYIEYYIKLNNSDSSGTTLPARHTYRLTGFSTNPNKNTNLYDGDIFNLTNYNDLNVSNLLPSEALNSKSILYNHMYDEVVKKVKNTLYFSNTLLEKDFYIDLDNCKVDDKAGSIIANVTIKNWKYAQGSVAIGTKTVSIIILGFRNLGYDFEGLEEYVNNLNPRPHEQSDIKKAVADFINLNIDEIPKYVRPVDVFSAENINDLTITKNDDGSVYVENIFTNTNPQVRFKNITIKPTGLNDTTNTIFNTFTLEPGTSLWSKVFTNNDKGFAWDWYNMLNYDQNNSLITQYIKNNISNLFVWPADPGTYKTIETIINIPSSNNTINTTATINYKGYSNGQYVQLNSSIKITLKSTDEVFKKIINEIEQELSKLENRPVVDEAIDGNDELLKDIISSIVDKYKDELPNFLIPNDGTFDRDNILISKIVYDNIIGNVTIPNISIDVDNDRNGEAIIGDANLNLSEVDSSINTRLKLTTISANSSLWNEIFENDKGFALDWSKQNNLDQQKNKLTNYLTTNYASLFENYVYQTKKTIVINSIQKPIDGYQTNITCNVTFKGYTNGIYGDVNQSITIILKSIDNLKQTILDKIQEALNKQPKPELGDEQKIKDIIAGVIENNKNDLPNAWLPEDAWPENGGTITKEDIIIGTLDQLPDGTISVPNITIDSDKSSTTGDTVLGDATIKPDVDENTNTTFNGLAIDANNKEEWSKVFKSDKGFAIDWNKATNLNNQQDLLTQYIKNNASTLFTGIVKGSNTVSSITTSINKPISADQTTISATINFMGYTNGQYQQKTSTNITITLKPTPSKGDNGVMDDLLDKIEQELNKPENRPVVDGALNGNKDPIKDIIAGVVDDNKNNLPDAMLPGDGSVDGGDITVGDLVENDDGSITVPDISIDTDGNGQGDVVIGDATVKPDVDENTNTTFNGLTINVVTGENWNTIFGSDKGFALDWYKAPNLDTQSQKLKQYLIDNYKTLFIDAPKGTAKTIELKINKPTSDEDTELTVNFTYSGYKAGKYVPGLSSTIKIILKSAKQIIDDILDKIEEELSKPENKPAVDDALEGNKDPIKDIIAGVVEDNKDNLPDAMIPNDGDITGDDIIIGYPTIDEDGNINIPNISIDKDNDGISDQLIGSITLITIKRNEISFYKEWWFWVVIATILITPIIIIYSINKKRIKNKLY